ncbi:hypothetical protein D7030_09870 [Flavobacteriaceae bacterium AU392]|nr:hypothetical protein D1817_06940 [Flavobacteriaceae bacterium]RKM83594.1 hypothetical protein D7030_09870 [Flavobacteriaceae bacterium AU392]
MTKAPRLYLKNRDEWRQWLIDNHNTTTGIQLILYKVSSSKESMRWEEAVQEAICFGWIDSTVKKLDEESRVQYFSPRKPKSVWSALNKKYIKELIASKRMHKSGLVKIEAAKKDGSWTSLDDVEKLVIPEDLQFAFNENPIAFNNYKNFAPSYRKGYLYWLNQAKRAETRVKRIKSIIQFCEQNIKQRATR